MAQGELSLDGLRNFTTFQEYGYSTKYLAYSIILWDTNRTRKQTHALVSWLVKSSGPKTKRQIVPATKIRAQNNPQILYHNVIQGSMFVDLRIITANSNLEKLILLVAPTTPECNIQDSIQQRDKCYKTTFTM